MYMLTMEILVLLVQKELDIFEDKLVMVIVAETEEIMMVAEMEIMMVVEMEIMMVVEMEMETATMTVEMVRERTQLVPKVR